MSGSDDKFEEFLDQFDPIGNAIEAANTGVKDARRYLFEQVADRINATGAIDDGSQAMYQLRLWFTVELDKIIEAMPGEAHRPENHNHPQWAVMVERRRRILKAENSTKAKNNAILDVAESVNRSHTTVKKAILPYREYAEARNKKQGKGAKSRRT
jgi:hypothetical protein